MIPDNEKLSNPQVTISVIKKYDFSFAKKFGQNFLIDDHVIKKIIKARAQYRGSGNPNFYTTESVLTEMLLLEDGIGHFLYPTKQALATALRVNDIITVPVFEQAGTRSETVGNVTTEYDLLGIIVNLKDYNVGADKGGSVNMFDDFDIDYNQQKYLIETRCSGALVKPFSALIIEAEHTTPSFLEIEPSMKPKPWAKRGGSVYPQPEETSGNDSGNETPGN